MYINCPLSTSIYCEVALKFSGEAGMILQLDNARGDCQMLKGMDVSWISRYREEDERYLYVAIYIALYTIFVSIIVLYIVYFSVVIMVHIQNISIIQ